MSKVYNIKFKELDKEPEVGDLCHNNFYGFFEWEYKHVKNKARTSSQEYNRFNMKVMEIDDSEVPEHLRVKVGSIIHLEDRSEYINHVVISIRVISNGNVIVDCVPEHTPVANPTKFHYGLFTSYTTIQY